MGRKRWSGTGKARSAAAGVGVVALAVGLLVGLSLDRAGDPKSVTKAVSTTVVRTVTATAPQTARRPLSRVVYPEASGFNPTALAPAGTEIRLWRVGSSPARMFVVYSRPEDPRNAKGSDSLTSGVLLWEQELFEDGRRWRLLYERPYPWWADVDVVLGDVTADGSPDVFHSTSQGSAGCGPRYVVAVVGGAARETFRRHTCESYFRIEPGQLLVDEPVGPCPVRLAGAHCFGGRREVALGWTGWRLAPTSTMVRCEWPDLELEPENECRRRK